MTESERALYLRPLRFASDLEGEFQARYYATVRPTLRLVTFFLTLLALTYLLLQYHTATSKHAAVGFSQLLLWPLILALTWVRGFGRVWQPTITLLSWIAAAFILNGLASVLITEVMSGKGVGSEVPTVAQQKFYFVLQLAVLMASLTTFRLGFVWSALLYCGVLGIGVGAYLTHLQISAESILLEMHFTLLPVTIILFAFLLASFTQEQLARHDFLSDHLLEEERNDERRKREQTEGKLQVLGQAIGGIVHDLGNPLTVVQTGAGTLKMFVESGDTDKETLQELTDFINDGAQMLDYLRLSLMEQTRVLEGKPIPVDLEPASLRHVIETGARYQKPQFVGGDRISIVGDDLEVCVDEKKMITVFMNLIGNALKYSDGEVRINWRTHEGTLLIAVLDQGAAGKGISEAQARQLFVAFGRLDAHAQVEGTGLGLLSVRKIVEAHGGEVFIEGSTDGTATSARFTTAQGGYPSMLAAGFCTAFVVACPHRSPA